MMTILYWIVKNHKTVFKALLSLSMAFLLGFNIILHKQNKRLSESLNLALNNIEAYLGIINDSLLANRVLLLTVEDLKYTNDSILKELNKVAEKNNIKPHNIKTAATQNQTVNVSNGKEVQGNLIEILKDTVYTDSIKYNDYTSVHYTIGKDTVNIAIDLLNTLYLYVYSIKEYKNKKSFIKRLITLDFKKVRHTNYNIYNTNSLINTNDVRVVELNNK